MKRLALLLLPLFCAAAPLARGEGETFEARLEVERKELVAEVAKLGEEIVALEAIYDEKILFQGLPPHRQRDLRLEALREIRLPVLADREQARAYIEAIINASKNQTSFAVFDPQPLMLARVGPDNADLILERVGDIPLYAITALRFIADERHKAAVLEALPRHQALIEIVIAKNWTNDAREILLAEMRARPEQVPSAWVYAVAEMRDPATYDDLKRCMVAAWNPSEVYGTIKDLEGIDLTDAVSQMWERAQQNAWLRPLIAGPAIEHGHADALAYVIENLNNPEVLLPRACIRAILGRCLDYDGLYEELPAWFELYKDRLVFDPASGTFAVQ